MILEGIQGALVTDPFTKDPGRFVGQRRMSKKEQTEDMLPGDRYTPCTVAAPYHPHLAKAVSRGGIKQIGEYVYATSPDAALASISSKSKPKPKAKSEKAQTSKEKGNE